MAIKVLLVDDHPAVRMGIKAILEQAGDIEVVGVATNGQEAIINTEQLKPDVVLMDVSMPVMDGIQATREILKLLPNSKIIMLTSHDNESHVLAAFAAGAAGYCLKDADSNRLYTAVRSVNAGDSWIDSAVASKVLKQQAAAGARISGSSRHSEGQQGDSPHGSDEHIQSDIQHTSDDQFIGSKYIPLSPREHEVLELIVEGYANKEISTKLDISLPTVKAHVRNILDKLAVDDRTQAAVRAMRQGIISSKS